jgi:O-antigen ligase
MKARKSRTAGEMTAKPRLGLRLAWGLTGLALALPPLLVWPALAEPFHLPKLLASELLGLLSALAVVVTVPLRSAPWRLPAVRATVPFLVVAAASVVRSDHVEHAREALWSLTVGIACLCAWSLWGARLRRLLDVLLLPALVLALFGILQFHDLFRPFAFTAGEEQQRGGVTSLAGSVADLGAFLVLPCLLAQLALGRALDAPGRARRWRLPLVAALVIVLHYGVIVSQTFTAFAALAAGSVVLWLPALSSRRHWSFAAVAGALVVLMVATVPPLRTRATNLLRNVSAGRLTAALSGRTDGWKAATWMFREHVVLGVGLGGYLPAFTPAKLALVDRGERFYRAHRGRSTFRNAHNEPLEVLAELGLVGVLALGWGVWVLVGSLRRRARDALEGSGERTELPLALGGLTALLVLALAYFPFRLALTGYPAAVFLAFVLVPAGDAPEAAAAPRPRWPALVAAGLLAMTMVFSWRRAERRLEASQIVRAVELINEAMIESNQMRRSLLYGQVRALRKALPLAPADVSIPLAVGGQYLLLGDGEEAERWLERARRLEPRPEIYAALATAQGMAGKSEEAQKSRAAAALLDPRTYGAP